MPAYHAILADATHRLSHGNIASAKQIIGEALADRSLSTLLQVVDVLEIPLSEPARAIVDALPKGMQGALLGLLYENLQRGEPFQMQFAWEPSYDYRLTIHEAFATDVSEGGITVIVGTRYPGDPAPGMR